MSDETQEQDAADTGEAEGSALGSTAAQKPDIGDEPDASAAFKGDED